jgi:hypothetical protein
MIVKCRIIAFDSNLNFNAPRTADRAQIRRMMASALTFVGGIFMPGVGVRRRAGRNGPRSGGAN